MAPVAERGGHGGSGLGAVLGSVVWPRSAISIPLIDGFRLGGLRVRNGFVFGFENEFEDGFEARTFEDGHENEFEARTFEVRTFEAWFEAVRSIEAKGWWVTSTMRGTSSFCGGCGTPAAAACRFWMVTIISCIWLR